MEASTKMNAEKSPLTLLTGDNLSLLKSFETGSFSLIYADPPYGCGKTFTGTSGSFSDQRTGKDFIDWLKPRIQEAHRLLTSNGSLFLHLDQREIHYVKVLCDEIFGRQNFIQELISHWDYGSRSKKKWSNKHQTILWYAKNHRKYIFNYDAIDRIPYKAPGLIRNTAKNAEEKIKKGKTPTSVWEIGIVHTLSKEKTGYPTQKPLKLLERIIKVHSNKGDHILDFFAGSGTTGDAALKNGRRATLIDENPEAIRIAQERLCSFTLNEKAETATTTTGNVPIKSPSIVVRTTTKKKGSKKVVKQAASPRSHG